MKQLIRFLTLCTVSTVATADNIEFSLSSDMVEAQYQTDFGKSYNTRINWLHADQDNIKSDLLGFGLYASNTSGQISTNLGGRAFWLNGEDSLKAHGLALGGSVAFAITPELSIGAGLLYSPDIINGGDFETYYDAEVRLGYKVMEHASIFVSYKNTEASINKFDYEIYKGGAVGFKFSL